MFASTYRDSKEQYNADCLARCQAVVKGLSYAKYTRSSNRRQKTVVVSGTSVMQSGAEFFWRQILESISQQNLAIM